MGTPSTSRFSFNLNSLFMNSSLSSHQANDLTRPFTLDEIKLALWGMNDHASPGPDGFGPAFYKANWDLVKLDLLNLLADFHCCNADLKRINKAFIVLLRKKLGSTEPANFRPISLQNSSVKIASKCLTNRAQTLIPLLIHHDQTGFIQGRGITQNFFLSADIVQTCYKRKTLAIVLKLDFHKAFDSVSWDALSLILQAKGFPPRWCQWIQSLNCSSSSAILLIGKPGPWFTCRRGL